LQIGIDFYFNLCGCDKEQANWRLPFRVKNSKNEKDGMTFTDISARIELRGYAQQNLTNAERAKML